MDLDRLRNIQQREQRTSSLQDIPDTFYSDAEAYLEELRTEREQVAAQTNDMFNDKVQSLSQQLQNAEHIIEGIYDRRLSKIIKQASLAASGVDQNTGALTDREENLYMDLVEAIEYNRSKTLSILSDSRPSGYTPSPDETDTGQSSTGTVASVAESDDSDGTTTDSDSSPKASEFMGGDDEDTNASTDGSGTSESTSSQSSDGGYVNDLSFGEPDDEATGATDGGEPDTPPTDDDNTNDTDETGATPDTDDATTTDPMPPEDDDFTSEFDSLGDDSDTTAGDSQTSTEKESNADDADGDGEEETERVTVRVSENVGEIMGVDGRTYELEAEDIVTLPHVNAQPLLDRGAAAELE